MNVYYSLLLITVYLLSYHIVLHAALSKEADTKYHAYKVSLLIKDRL